VYLWLHFQELPVNRRAHPSCGDTCKFMIPNV
jgi:hypothetical protein